MKLTLFLKINSNKNLIKIKKKFFYPVTKKNRKRKKINPKSTKNKIMITFIKKQRPKL